MSDDLVQIDGAPRPRTDPRVIANIAINLVAVCAVSAILLGGVYAGTDRYQRAARLAGERAAVARLLRTGPGASVTEVRQYLDAPKREVVYLARPYGDEGAAVRSRVFGLDGALRASNDSAPAQAPVGAEPLGRLFVAAQHGAVAGFVIEGEARGYKKRIRFFVALDPALTVRGIQVIEHEEDPGLGAEIATPVFQGQFVGRSADEISALDVTRDPMPEDWRSALSAIAASRGAAAPAVWAQLLPRERTRPIYAVTGATISSRALTRGVQGTVDHFRRRWALLAPHFGIPGDPS